MELKGQILLYTETGCRECMSTKTKLESLLLPYSEVDLLVYPDRRYEMENLTDRDGVPQIFFNDNHIGGYYDLIELEGSGKLDEMIVKVKNDPTPNTAPQPPGISAVVDNSDGNTSAKRAKLTEMIIKMGNQGILSEIRVFFTVHHNAFYGKDLVAWLTEEESCSYEEALITGVELIKEGFIVHVSDPKHPFTDSSQQYKLVGVGHPSALNSGLAYHGANMSPIQISANLRKCITTLYANHISEDGYKVNYDTMKSDVEFARYVMTTQKLQRVSLDNLTRQETISIFINIYNALLIHAIVSQGPPTNHLHRYRFFKKVSYIIGGQIYSLNDIENGVLRGNQRGVTDICKPFSQSDKRLSISLDKPDPRIHFALNCGSKGCPPIRVYTAENIETQLNRATKSFLTTGGCEVNSDTHQVSLSSILKWYRVDFGSNNHEMLQWVCGHIRGTEDGRVLQEMIDARIYKISWQNYDWSLNH